MTRHDKNHAAGSEACQPNGVQEEVARIPFPQTLADVNPWKIPVSWLSDPIEVKIGGEWQVFEELLPSSKLLGVRRQAAHSGRHWANVQGLLPIQFSEKLPHRQKAWLKILLAVTALLCLYRLFQFLSSQESSFLGFDKERMDDGGRCGNVPPNAAGKKAPQKQSGVAK